MVFPAALLYNEHNRILKNSQEVIIMNIGEQIRTYRKSHNHHAGGRSLTHWA